MTGPASDPEVQAALACHRCGLPLADDEPYCPYCEQRVYARRWQRLWHWRPAERAHQVRRRVVREEHVLAAGFLFFLLVALMSLLAALLL